MTHILDQEVIWEGGTYQCVYDLDGTTVHITKVYHEGEEFDRDNLPDELISALENYLVENHQESNEYISEVAGKMYRGRI